MGIEYYVSKKYSLSSFNYGVVFLRPRRQMNSSLSKEHTTGTIQLTTELGSDQPVVSQNGHMCRDEYDPRYN